MNINKATYCMVILALILVFPSSMKAAYLRNVPQFITQPSGLNIKCLGSGDDYYNWLHDQNGYVIISNPQDGFWVYADKVDGYLIPTKYRVGYIDPRTLPIDPNLKPDPDTFTDAFQFSSNKSGMAPQTGVINNIVIFIRFSDDVEFIDLFFYYDFAFNLGSVSMKNYFLEASYNNLTVNSTFYPVPSGATVISYQDGNPRDYYRPYNAASNPIGYTAGERLER